MLSISLLCKELESRGIRAEKKNLNLDTDEISKRILGLILYTEDANVTQVLPVNGLLQLAPNMQEAADFVEKWFKSSVLPSDIDYSSYLTKDYILGHVEKAFCSRIWAHFITRESIFPGILEFCYIYDIVRKIYWSIEIRQDTLDDLGISVDELWDAAERNTFSSSKNFVLRSVIDIVGKKASKLIEKGPAKDFHSISNKLGLYGSIQVLNPKINSFFEKYSVDKIIIYPQSKNNFMIAPFNAETENALKGIAMNDEAHLNLVNDLYVLKLSDDGLQVDQVIPYSFEI